MAVEDTLIAARALIASPGTWTQGAYARTAAGEPCAWDSPHAVCFCAAGALYRVTEKPTGSPLTPRRTLDAALALNEAAGRDFVSMQDASTHAEVLSIFDTAIENVSARERVA